MPEVLLPVDDVHVASALAPTGYVALRDKVGHDPADGSLRDADPLRDVADACAWVLGHRQQHQTVVREEGPGDLGGIGLFGPVADLAMIPVSGTRSELRSRLGFDQDDLVRFELREPEPPSLRTCGDPIGDAVGSGDVVLVDLPGRPHPADLAERR
jgi:hypothetical protein